MAAEGNGDLPVPDLRTMEELCQPSLNGRGGPIAPIAIQATNFGLKNDMIQQVQNSCQFHGLPGDDANKHLDKFLHVTQSIKVNRVTDDALRLYLFPHSLTHHATTWFDRLPRNSINTFKQMAKMFLGKYFPPSMVTKLRNEITNFRQRSDESLFEAQHVARGTFMKRRPEECYDLIENMTAHHNDWDTSAQRKKELPALKAEMVEINKNLMRVLQGASHGQNPPLAYQALDYQASVHQPPIPQPQVVTTNEVTNFMKANDAILKNMQTNMTSLTNSNLELKNMFGQFMKMNTASSLGSGTLPGNAITNPKEDFKGITTCSGTAYQGPTIPTTSSSLPKVVERETEVTKDTLHPTNNGSTKDVQPPGDPGKFLILCDFLGMAECLALADLDASINLMPLSVWNKLSLPELSPTCMTLELADHLISRLVGVAKDVFVKVGTFYFLADFVVIDFDADPRVLLILGRSFLKTKSALIDVFEGELTIHVGKEAITFNLDQTSRYSANYNDMMANQIDDIYAAGSESRPHMLNKENYVPWSSRLLRYAKSRPNEKLIHNSILNGPYVRRMIPEPGDAKRDVNVNETFHEQTDNELSERELKQIEADDQAIQTILLGLPEDIYAAFEDYYSDILYVVSIKEDTAYMCMHFVRNHEDSKSNTLAKKLEKTHDPLAVVAHTNSSSQSPSPNYVTHPPSVVDYDGEYKGETFQNDSEDPLTSTMMLLARAITQRYSTPTNNRLHSSSNIRNQTVVQADKVNIYSRNLRNDGRITRRSYNVQEEYAEGSNVQKETGNVQRNLPTSSTRNVTNV
nr:reverse transcriptase domain-containing protein [Tanacetum cinerariifolium]